MKKIIAALMVFVLLFTFTSCSTEGQGTLIGESGTQEGLVYDMAWDGWSEKSETLYKGNTTVTANGSVLKLVSVKEKSIVAAPLAVLTLVYDVVVMVVGGLVYFPGWIQPDKEHNYIDAKFKFTNETGKAMLVSDAAQACVAKVGESYYAGSVVFEEFGGFRLSSDSENTVIKSGKSKKIHFLIEIPEIYLDSNTDIDIIFEIDGSMYVYDYQ